MITTYAIDAAIVSYMRRGSAPSEQNHSSIVSYIGRDFTSELIDILVILLERHEHKNEKTNETIAKEDNYMIMKVYNVLTEHGKNSQLF